ncbi:hypothetical protein [Pedobacter caeni]|nr:hypothetical protein [Pedobacter caeni]
MKKIKILLSLAIIIGIIVVSCKKSELTSDKDSDQLSEKSKHSNAPGPVQPKPPQLVAMELFAGYQVSSTPLPTTETAAATLLAPLMANSRQYLYEAGLSSSDLVAEFSSLNNYQIAYVAFQLRRIDVEGGWTMPGCNVENKVIKCIIQSLVPCTLMDYFQGKTRDVLMAQGFRAGFNMLTYSAKRSVVKLLATRAATMFGTGGLGLALFVYDFSLCMLNDGGVLVPNYPDILPGTAPRNDLVTPNEPLTFPANYSQQVFYTKYYSHIGSYSGKSTSNVPKPSTLIFYNSMDLKYYRNALFTKTLPDGFYILTEDLGSSSNRYREVVNGKVVLVAAVKNPDPYRALEVFDPATHTPFFQ